MTDASPTQKLPIGVVISGGGTNLQSLIDRALDGSLPVEIKLVVSNNPDAFGLERAKKAGIPTRVVDHRGFGDRGAFEEALIEVLDGARVELVALAGFMRVLTPLFVNHYAGRLLNIHPALLPSFPGLNVQQQAIDAGVRFSGATVHFVTEGVDAGPIVAQAVVPILPHDDAKALAARILQQEHRLYPLAIRLFAEGRLSINGQRVEIQAPPTEAGPSLLNPPEGA
ncbi:MAG: phosphoribosylglycinamide formyltransferase [Magnetococcales bacterium]|nr:phosphoribosylglycinamide formyltransferase [Magnetococcales bacterium]